MQVITLVSGAVPTEAADDLVSAYRALTDRLPPAIVQSFLLRGDGGEWRVMSHWRSREALEEYRRSVSEPAAVKLFRDVGAEPVVSVLDVAHHATA